MSYKEAPTAPCSSCGAETTRLPDGACSVCSARAAAREERARRQDQKRKNRDQLGFAPLTRSLHLAGYALEVAEERATVAAQYAGSEDQGLRLERALHLIHAARAALR